VYFVCLEALQNVAKHAGSDTSARVSLAVDGDELLVEIVDDGPGFDAARTGPTRGLLNMADRAGALGGDLTIDSTPGAGTRVTMVLPHRTLLPTWTHDDPGHRRRGPPADASRGGRRHHRAR
jgi:signal transduction histidine kinase